MSIYSGFYNSQNHDRTYSAAQFSNIFDGIINDGIFMNVGTALMVASVSGMRVNVGVGRAWFNGTWTYNDALYPLTLDASELLLNRIDAIILEVNTTDEVRNNTIKIKKQCYLV